MHFKAQPDVSKIDVKAYEGKSAGENGNGNMGYDHDSYDDKY